MGGQCSFTLLLGVGVDLVVLILWGSDMSCGDCGRARGKSMIGSLTGGFNSGVRCMVFFWVTRFCIFAVLEFGFGVYVG